MVSNDFILSLVQKSSVSENLEDISLVQYFPLIPDIDRRA